MDVNLGKKNLRQKNRRRLTYAHGGGSQGEHISKDVAG